MVINNLKYIYDVIDLMRFMSVEKYKALLVENNIDITPIETVEGYKEFTRFISDYKSFLTAAPMDFWSEVIIIPGYGSEGSELVKHFCVVYKEQFLSLSYTEWTDILGIKSDELI